MVQGQWSTDDLKWNGEHPVTTWRCSEKFMITNCTNPRSIQQQCDNTNFSWQEPKWSPEILVPGGRKLNEISAFELENFNFINLVCVIRTSHTPESSFNEIEEGGLLAKFDNISMTQFEIDKTLHTGFWKAILNWKKRVQEIRRTKKIKQPQIRPHLQVIHG